MKHQIVKNIQRADAGVIKALGEQGVGAIHEAQSRTGLMRPYLRPIYPAACDVAVGDLDGVVIVRREYAAAVAQLGQKRLEKEANSRAKLKAGELGVDFYGLRAKLKELGVEYLDE